MDIEQVRLQPAEGKEPEEPSDYGANFKPPEHCVKLLQIKFAHERDSRMKFYAEPHIYSVDGTFVDTSATSLVHLHENGFDPDNAINKMKMGANWPRLEYVTGLEHITNVDDFVTTKGNMLVYDGKCAAYLRKDDLSDASSIEIITILQDLSKIKCVLCDSNTCNHYKWYVFEDIMSTNKIKDAWSKKGEDARNRGTEGHLQMELWANSEPCRMLDPSVVVGHEFIRNVLLPLNITVFRTEWELFADEEDFAGSVDLVAKTPDNKLVIIDWKRSPKLKDDLFNKYSKMKPPFNHLHDSKGAKYAIQLSIYMYMLQKYYGYQVSQLLLVSIHEDNPFYTSVPYMKPEIEYLMQQRRQITMAKHNIIQRGEHKHLICELSKKLITSGGKDEQGRLLHSKQAAILDIEIQRDSNIEAEVDALIQQELVPIDFPKSTIWTKLMKREGNIPFQNILDIQ